MQRSDEAALRSRKAAGDAGPLWQRGAIRSPGVRQLPCTLPRRRNSLGRLGLAFSSSAGGLSSVPIRVSNSPRTFSGSTPATSDSAAGPTGNARAGVEGAFRIHTRKVSAAAAPDDELDRIADPSLVRRRRPKLSVEQNKGRQAGGDACLESDEAHVA